MRKHLILLLLIPSVLFSQENIKFSKTIIVEDLQKHLNVLASDSLEGRETGKKGQKMAADYIANHFNEIGIPPYKKETYYQKFKVKSKKHVCKCEDCDVGFVKQLFGKKRRIKGESEIVFISEAGYVYHKESIGSISKNEKHKIDISKIPAGKYLVTIVNGKTYTTPQKLIIL